MEYLRSFIVLVIGSCMLTCGREQAIVYDTIITNVNLIDGTGSPLREGVNVYIHEGKIARIDQNEVLQAGNLIDGSGKYLMPGLFDCHVHTADYQQDFPKFIHYGVTSVFIPGGSRCTDEYYASMRALGAQDSLPAPRVFHTSQHFTMEGRHPVKTYSNSSWEEGKTVYFLRDTAQIADLVRQEAQQSVLGIKLTIEDGPHPPMVERMPQVFIDKVQTEAEKNGIQVFAHISDNTELEMAIQAGIKNLVHFTGVDLDSHRDSALLYQIYHDSLNWVTTLMLDKSFIYPLHPEWLGAPELQGVFTAKDFSAMEDPGYLFRANDYMTFMQEYLQIDQPSLKDLVAFQVADIKILLDHGVNMVLGTDTGNDFIFPGYSLHEEMQLLELGGLDPLQIIKMATLNAAKMMQTEQSLGSIEVGKMADMLLLDKNPLDAIKNSLTLNMVIKNGLSQQRIEK